MKRQIIIDGDVAYVPLTRGCVATIDAADVGLVEGYNWSANPSHNTFYAQRRIRVGVNQPRMIMMHRVILGLTNHPAVYVDHIDGDGLNNRRQNIRACSASENGFNRGAPRTNTSGFKGVSWDVQAKKWQANIRVRGVQINLGRFSRIEEADEAYRAAAYKYHGEFNHIYSGRRRTGALSTTPAASLPGVQ
ncbi:MAG: Fis family transcriptional regulator [Rhodospirillaceae bacterium]|nr:MAG: Fis family transcriptional regulator [Rhodospirillaceae bacterium]